jgi:large subunit ribosomal protein L11
MAKKQTKIIKLVVAGGKAAPGVPLGPVLGSAGVNIGEFIKQFNAETADKGGMLMNVVLTVYDDRSFDYILKSSPMSALIKAAAGIGKGASKNRTQTVGKLTIDQVRSIAMEKLPDSNANDVEAVMQMVRGTARSMGVKIID